MGYLIFSLGVILTGMLEAVIEGVCIICQWVELVIKMDNVCGSLQSSEEEFSLVSGVVSTPLHGSFVMCVCGSGDGMKNVCREDMGALWTGVNAISV